MTDIEHIRANAEMLVTLAEAHGVVLTIERKPLAPFAMGHSEHVIEVRPARELVAIAPKTGRAA